MLSDVSTTPTDQVEDGSTDASSPHTAQLADPLTARELEVLGLIAEGLANGEIATRLYVSLNTVRNHVSRILRKLDAHSKLEALVIADRRGLLSRRVS